MAYSNNPNGGAPYADAPIKPVTPKKTTETENDDEGGCFSEILEWVSLLVAFPLFLLLSNILPNPDWVFNLDRILLFLATASVVYWIANEFVIITTLGLLVGIGFLTYGSIASGDHYGWRNAVFDYSSMIYSLKGDSGNQIDYIIGKLSSKEIKEIKEACDYNNPKVRNAALQYIKEDRLFVEYAEENHEYKVFIQACAICKRVNKEWNYVHDPKGEEYFAKASESIIHLSGDCDDHAVLLASLIRAIGGETRIVLAPGHAYPEIRVDKENWNDINYLIKRILFKSEAGNAALNSHQEGKSIWLNMDYTGVYPGAKFLNTSEKVSVVNI